MSEVKENPEKPKGKDDELPLLRKQKIMLAIPLVVLLTGMVMTLIYPMGIEENGVNFFGYVKYASVSVLIAGTSLLIGGFTGFLFGIPRTLQDLDNSDNSQDKQFSYRVNTNLEQISDWLTKILVGVGLTQLSSVPSKLEKLSIFLTTTLSDNEDKNAGIYAVIVILYFLVCGFPLGYLSTRLLITTAFARADNAYIREMRNIKEMGKQLTDTTERIEKTLTEREKQLEIDSEVLSRVYLYLESMDRKNIEPEEIEKAIQRVSSIVKEEIFSQAQKIRTDNWTKAENKDTLERVIHILKILLKDESGNIPKHKLQAELGYALKDKEVPDLGESEKCLKKAIELRGDWWQEGNRIYEFNRAYCLIQLDKDFKKGKKNSNEQERQEIIDLIAIAVSRKKLRRIISENNVLDENPKNKDVFKQWIKINDVTKREIDKKSSEELIKAYPIGTTSDEEN